MHAWAVNDGLCGFPASSERYMSCTAEVKETQVRQCVLGELGLCQACICKQAGRQQHAQVTSISNSTFPAFLVFEAVERRRAAGAVPS